jgi:glycolate oxidase FAD binding subunit
LTDDQLISRLIRITGEDDVTSAPPSLVDFAVDGVLPRVAISPSDVEQIGEVLKFADAERLAVVPRGSGTQMHIGNPPSRADVVLSTTRLNRIIEHDADNLTVIAEAGVTLPSLQTALAERGQRLPLDPPASEQSTLGGIAATHAFGPRRLLYRAPRDLIVGLHAVLPNGELVKAGGKVVKNVSGYDLCKTFISSFGTLGVITQTTWRLYPLVEQEQTLLAWFEDASQALGAAARIMDSYLVPASLIVANAPLSPIMASHPLPLLIALFDGVAEAIERQVGQATAGCQAQGAVEVQALSGDAQAHCWQALRDFPRRFTYAPHSLVCRAAVPLTQLEDLTREAEDVAPTYQLSAHVCVHAGVGMIWVHLVSPAEDDEGSLTRLIAAATALREAAERAQGYLVVEYAPTPLKKRISVWGDLRSDASLMRRLKRAFDPQGILNPDRFIA